MNKDKNIQKENEIEKEKTLSDEITEIFEKDLLGNPNAGRIYRKLLDIHKKHLQEFKEELKNSFATGIEYNEYEISKEIDTQMQKHFGGKLI